MSSKLGANLGRLRDTNLLRRLMYGYAWPMRWQFAAAILMMLLVAATTSLSAYMMQPMIDGIFADQRRDLLLPIAMAILAIFIVKGFSAFGQRYIMNNIGRKITARIQSELFAKLMHADLARFQASQSGRLIAHLTNDVGLMYSSVSNGVTAFGRDLVTLIGLLFVMLTLDPELFLIGAFAIPGAIIPIVLIGRRSRKIVRRTQDTVGILTNHLGEVFRGIRHVKADSAEERETARAQETIWNLSLLRQKQVRTEAASSPIMETLAGLAIVAVLLYGGNQILDGVRTPGTFFAFITALLLSHEPMKRLANLNVQLQHGLAGAERVFATLDSTPDIADRPDSIDIGIANGRVELRDVAFRYGPEAPALNGVDIIVNPGQTIALVGPSGAGKSTILNLIPRFFEASRGQVLIDGHDVRDVTLHSLRRNIALVSQDVTLFDDSIRANIAYSRPEASEAEIIAAAKAAAAHEFIVHLPDGYNTKVGEHGVRLSGGQRQRLSIARAMLKDAPILLLDEATSALDTESERQVQLALKRLMRGRTTVVIAHRLSTVADADVIYVMNEGRVVEMGRHAELIARNGLYARLWSLQTGEEEASTHPEDEADGTLPRAAGA